MFEIVVKKENHANALDKEEELKLLKEDFDVLVLEGQENRNNDWGEFGPLTTLFVHLSNLFFWIMGPIYQPRDSLGDIARYKEMDIEYTREGDHELIENAPISLRVLALVAFYGFFLGSMYFGIHEGGYLKRIIYPSAWLLGAVMSPLILLRMYNSRFNRSENRDRKMAEVIEDAAEKGRTIAIIGGLHEVENYFETENYEIIEPKAVEKTWSTVVDFLPRILKTYFILLSIYLITREIMAYLVNFV